MDRIRKEMDMLGYLLGERENALEYLEWHDKYVGIVDERLSGLTEDEKPDVFLFYGAGTTETTCLSGGKGSFTHPVCERAGGKNIAADLKVVVPTVEAEWVIQQDIERGIDVMLGVAYYSGYGTDDASKAKEQYDKIVGMPGFDSITAVRSNRVHLIARDILCAPELPVGLVYVAKWFHPELFADLDPEAIHQEYVDEFGGIDFDVTEQGVFVYPKPS